MSYQERFMLRALELAELGRGRTNPNPLVGAVLVQKGKIAAEGYHQAYGSAHAEVNALAAAGKKAKGAALYVTLEPCSHYGKTPPCALAIIKAGVSKVFIGAVDPNPLVAGKGIAILRKAGVEVHSDLLSEKVSKQNEIFWHYIKTNTPFVVFKSAASLDGKTATAGGESQWISCRESRALVHRWRKEMMAVMVGVGTVLADDPSLTAREQGEIVGEPYRVVLDAFGKTPLSAKLFAQPTKAKTVLVCADSLSIAKQKSFEKLGARVIKVACEQGKLSAGECLRRLGELKIDSVLLEGGATLAASFLQSGAINKVQLFLAPKLIGGQDARSIFAGGGVANLAQATALSIESVKRVGEDLLVSSYIKKEERCLPE